MEADDAKQRESPYFLAIRPHLTSFHGLPAMQQCGWRKALSFGSPAQISDTSVALNVCSEDIKVCYFV